MKIAMTTVLAATSVLALTGAAQASLFSFASDRNDTLPTFVGTAGAGGTFTLSNAPDNRFTLLLDDDNGPVPVTSVDVGFVANLSGAFLATVPFVGNTFQHTYSINGSFKFVDRVTGADLLIANVNNGLFFTAGSRTSWSTAAVVSASDSIAGGSVSYTATQAFVDKLLAAGVDPTAYGIRVGTSSGTDDAGFSLSSLLSNVGGLVALGSGGLPTTSFTAEGSFSGSAAGGVPTPAAASLLGLAGLVAMGRRRNSR
jgi:hypothetical protein